MTTTRIQQNIGGFNIDDIVHDKLAEMEREKREQARRKKNRGIEKIDENSTLESETNNEQEYEVLRQSLNLRGIIWQLSENENYFWVHINNIRRGVQTGYTFTKQPLDGGQAHSYNQWREIATSESASGGFVPASLEDIHVLARASWELRGKEKNTPSGFARQFLINLFNNNIENDSPEKKQKICFYSRISQLTPRFIDSEGRPEERSIIHSEGTSEEHQHFFKTYSTQSTFGIIEPEKRTLRALFHDDRRERVEKIYQWICTPPTKKDPYKLMFHPVVRDADSIPAISIRYQIPEIYIMPSYKTTEPFRTIGVKKEERGGILL